MNLEADVLAKYVEKLLASLAFTMAVTTPFATIEEAIEDIREGRMVIVVDDEDRENEGDLTIAAQFATPDAINFMATHARGLICLCLTEERADELALRPMTDRQRSAARDRVHRLDRGARRCDDGHLGRRPQPHDPGGDPARVDRRSISFSPVTSFRCARAAAACSNASARPRRRSTSRGWPGSTRPASSARS